MSDICSVLWTMYRDSKFQLFGCFRGFLAISDDSNRSRGMKNPRKCYFRQNILNLAIVRAQFRVKNQPKIAKNCDFLKFSDPKIAQNRYYGLKLVSTDRVAQEDHVELLFSQKY